MLKKSKFPKIWNESKKGLFTVKCAFFTVKCAFCIFHLLSQSIESIVTYDRKLDTSKMPTRYTYPLKGYVLSNIYYLI